MYFKDNCEQTFQGGIKLYMYVNKLFKRKTTLHVLQRQIRTNFPMGKLNFTNFLGGEIKLYIYFKDKCEQTFQGGMYKRR